MIILDLKAIFSFSRGICILVTKYHSSSCGHVSQEDQQDMYEFLEDDYDPRMTVQERRERRRGRLLQQYEQAQTEESALTAKLDVQRKNVRDLFICGGMST